MEGRGRGGKNDCVFRVGFRESAFVGGSLFCAGIDETIVCQCMSVPKLTQCKEKNPIPKLLILLGGL